MNNSEEMEELAITFLKEISIFKNNTALALAVEDYSQS